MKYSARGAYFLRAACAAHSPPPPPAKSSRAIRPPWEFYRSCWTGPGRDKFPTGAEHLGLSIVTSCQYKSESGEEISLEISKKIISKKFVRVQHSSSSSSSNRCEKESKIHIIPGDRENKAWFKMPHSPYGLFPKKIACIMGKWFHCAQAPTPTPASTTCYSPIKNHPTFSHPISPLFQTLPRKIYMGTCFLRALILDKQNLLIYA